MFAVEDQLSADILDALDTGVMLLDGQRRVLVWNRWLVAASGIPVQKALAKTLEELFADSFPHRLMSAIAGVFESGMSSFLTHSLHPSLLPLKTRAGEYLIHSISVTPLGSRPHVRCLLQIADLTVAVHRERILRERQNARYDAVVESAPDAILTLDSDGIIQLVNPAAANHFQYTMQELIGRPVIVLLKDRTIWSDVWNSVVKGGPSRSIRVLGQRKDGSVTYLEVSASRWLSDSRVFVTVIFHDMNVRRAAEEALHRLNRTLEERVAERTADRDRMWRLSTDVMVVARLDGTINAVNPAWHHLLGWEEGDMVGSNIEAFIVPEDRPQFEIARAALSASSAPKLFEVTLLTRNRATRRIEWSAVASDNLLQAVGRDVTAEREAEKALRGAEEALRQAQKMEAIGQLTGGIAHDFNNLLTGIIGAMDALKRRIAVGRYDDLARFMDAAISSSNRAAALTHRLLAFARRQPLNPQAVEANRLVRGMEDLLRRTLGEQVKLVTDLAPDLWPAFTDAHQLENALLNLAINARDAMPTGGQLTIATRNILVAEAEHHGQDEIDPGDYTVIAVSDTGVGMSPEVVPKIFEPFFTTKPIGQGTGLGLSMIYGFAKQSRGHIRIESTLGRGTQASLYLPRYMGPLMPDFLLDTRDAPLGKGEAVLLVEDDSSVRLLIGEVLRDLGYACIEASDGQAALPMLTSNARLDLMITDVGLPGMNGRELAEIARQHRPSLKILFVTGYAEHATGKHPFLEQGMEMVTKPFMLDALALKIRQMLADSR
ncbi:MAG TPA: PAS domain-containing protein [Micropepsaceae bacterium]|jgi:PAS domain S-box-containing protein